MKKIAVTGSLSAGKSTVCRLFKELGAYVVSADEIVHQLLSIQSELTSQVIGLFGSEIVVDGHIDRSQVAKKAFRQPALLKSLEAILHPAVRNEIEKQYNVVVASDSYPLFIAEIPLLFETGAERFYDASIAVIADEEQSFQRFCAAHHGGRTEYDRRMSFQLPAMQKAKMATYLIVNSGSMADLTAAVAKLYTDLTSIP